MSLVADQDQLVIITRSDSEEASQVMMGLLIHLVMDFLKEGRRQLEVQRSHFVTQVSRVQVEVLSVGEMRA